jgi:hypothetical protein
LTTVIILFFLEYKQDLSSDLNVEDLHRFVLSKQNKIASTGTIKFEVGLIANCDDSEFFASILEIALYEF